MRMWIVKVVCESFQLGKDAGYTIVAHMMPDLPNVDFERDIEQVIVSFFLNCFHFRLSMIMMRIVFDLGIL